MSTQPDLPLNCVLVGDVRTRLAELPDASVDCIITSPPYWALRNYGHDGQIGAESTVEEWAEQIAAVCDQLARVLTPTGSLWLNLGDSYARSPRDGAAKKSLLLAPQRVALRLTRAGWLLRNQVIWAKKNPMPSSVGDRLTTTHEFVYFFTRQPNYYFDLDAIREPAMTHPHRGRAGRESYPPRAAVPNLGSGTSPRVDLNQGLAGMKARGQESHPLGKNPGDVWHLGTASYHGAHFATFPTELVRRPLLSTCPQRVCTTCGQPWRKATQVIDGRRLALGSLRADCGHTGWRRGRVLDPFLGSGTVALAAEQYDRDWLGIELNPAYAELAEQRLAAWRETQATKRKEQ
ncbi:site-specific DNA-methyltransferase [Umezawaea sp. Da 62-37]|uniref:DNA-methyltransferase n=1 Tax=Umezawaea sp. Da 62-37 TaxID=3075927 RepID=UPI0028F6E64A|nr:site-specific DNA-methyltransferase [Umezawaea sp. Da 62-37]WNV83467.1 site-specific DNA-methyltransferase [Umezawaea sp. Da 62-37]